MCLSKASPPLSKDVARLLQHAAMSLQLLTMPHADDDTQGNTGALETVLPDGEERSEMFVQEATAYFQTLNVSSAVKMTARTRASDIEIITLIH